MNRKNSKVTGNSVFLKPNYSDSVMKNLLEQLPPKFDSILKMKDYQVQILYTQIDRGKKGKVKFTDHSFNLDSSNYFYPASTVKLPVAILALQKLNELKIAGLDKNTTMITGSTGSRRPRRRMARLRSSTRRMPPGSPSPLARSG